MNKETNVIKTIFGIIVVALCCLLAGCVPPQTVGYYPNRHDGLPAYPVDVSRVPNAVPKPLPKSRYGNPHHYAVFGKRYHVLYNSKGYDQVGTASWYGTKFHGRMTSSRERYNMFEMTAASRTLPLPTFVQVTNLRNGRRVILKVNDRGPFHSNRLIDVSYAAAKKLGFINTGTAKVRVTAIDPYRWQNQQKLASPSYQFASYARPVASSRSGRSTHYVRPTGAVAMTTSYADDTNDSNSTSTSSLSSTFTSIATSSLSSTQHPSRPYYFQVGAFANLRHARELRNRVVHLTSLHLASHNVKIHHTVSHRNHLYRVQVGPIRNIRQAQIIQSKLADNGLNVIRL